MLKTILAAAAVVSMATLPAAADLSNKHGRPTKQQAGDRDLLPPDGYSAQWWTSPDQCQYSRAGRPGETIWFLIVNSAHRGCAPYLVQRGFADAY